uniref:Uncharacterized protein n=1 Tax=Noccaea caerulescens TaxID=107243 RepID=A0A1J3FY92_NOCCA
MAMYLIQYCKKKKKKNQVISGEANNQDAQKHELYFLQHSCYLFFATPVKNFFKTTLISKDYEPEEATTASSI